MCRFLLVADAPYGCAEMARDCLAAVRRKMRAYHAYVQTALIVRGLMVCASLLDAPFILCQAPWMRTLPSDRPPSEWAVGHALRATFGEFPANRAESCAWVKFLVHARSSAPLHLAA